MRGGEGRGGKGRRGMWRIAEEREGEGSGGEGREERMRLMSMILCRILYIRVHSYAFGPYHMYTYTCACMQWCRKNMKSGEARHA